jgi:hypothetical protein
MQLYQENCYHLTCHYFFSSTEVQVSQNKIKFYKILRYFYWQYWLIWNHICFTRTETLHHTYIIVRMIWCWQDLSKSLGNCCLSNFRNSIYLVLVELFPFNGVIPFYWFYYAVHHNIECAVLESINYKSLTCNHKQCILIVIKRYTNKIIWSPLNWRCLKES